MDRERLLSHFEAHPDRAWPLEEILEALGVGEAKEKTVRRLLKGLVHEAKIEREPGRNYRLARAGQRAQGTVRVGRDGRLTVVVSGPKNTRSTLSLLGEAGEGDRVEIEMVTDRRGGAAARLVQVLSKPRSLGQVRRVGRALYIEPTGRREGPVAISEDPSLDDGMLVEYEITTPRSRAAGAVGKIVTVLGRPGERPTEVRRLEIDHELPLRFPVSVEHAASQLGKEVSPEEVGRRRDLRSLPLVTIDGETARDFDDAVCAEKIGKDSFKVWVAIADVAHYVTPHGPIDREARKRGTSTYLPDRVYPMLPEALSNELCSLKPNVDRLCFVAEMVIDSGGAVVSSEFYRATMRSRARLTYNQVAAALDGQVDEVTRQLLPQLVLLYKVAQARLVRRLKRGAIDLDLPEAELRFEDGLPVDSFKRERNDAHRLIEDLMLLANESVAAWFQARDLHTIYRIHEDPNPDKLAVFAELCAEVGVVTKWKKTKVRPRDVSILLRELSEHPAGKHLHALLLRTLAQARYAVDNGGHFGLAAEEYLHFTSPIRRYPDLMVHRLLAAHLEERDTGYTEEALRAIADECSELERHAALAEREARDLDRAYVAALHIGEPMQGTVTGVQAFGVFVAVDKPFVEGMIPIDQLGDDWFEADERGAYLTGKRTGTRVSLGMPIAVEVVRVDIEQRRVELRPLEDVTGRGGATSRGASTGKRGHVVPKIEGESPLDRLRRTVKARDAGFAADARKMVKGPPLGQKKREQPDRAKPKVEKSTKRDEPASTSRRADPPNRPDKSGGGGGAGKKATSRRGGAGKKRR